jgi:hypothetical protein
MTTTLCPTLLDRNVVPLAELLAMCLDGHLYRVGDAFACADTPETPELRARSLLGSVPAGAVVEGGSAAWVHGTRGTPPPRLQICRLPGNRGKPVGSGVESRQRALHRDELTSVGALTVTAPLRTAADLMLSAPRFGEAEALEVRHLLELAGAFPGDLRPLLPRSRHGGSGRAERRLAAVRRIRLPDPLPRDGRDSVSRR